LVALISIALHGETHEFKQLELENFPPKQQLWLLHKSVGHVTELAYLTQIGDQGMG
jgi:hypothetical protein